MNLSSLLGTVRKKTFAATAVRPARRRPRLSVDTLEAREVPATLPAPVIGPQSYTGIAGAPVINGDGSGGAFAPAVAIDPGNALRMFEVNVIYTDAARTQTTVEAQFSTNGGKAWIPLGIFPLGIDPKVGPATSTTYTNVSNPSVAIDSTSHAYVTFIERNADSTSGRLVLYRFDMSGTPSLTDISNNSDNGIPGFGPEHVLYKWVNTDEAYNPVVAVDTNRGSFSDTQPNATVVTQTDALAAAQTAANQVRVFVAWNTRNIAPANATNFNPNVIKMAVSDDGGSNFGPPVLLNDDGNFNAAGFRYSQPQLIFTQGRSGQAGTGGRMVTAFTENTFQDILADTHTFTGATIPDTSETSRGGLQTIVDAIDPGSNPHIAQVTNYTINVPAGSGVTAIQNLSVTLNLHHPDLKTLKAELISPAGTIYTLFENATNANGDDRGVGLRAGGTDMGLINVNLPGGFTGYNVGSTFQDNAPRRINDGSAAAPYTGTYRPENGTTLNTAFGGQNPAGTWTIRLTDFRNSGSPPPAAYIQSASLKFSQRFGTGSDGLDADNVTGAFPAKSTVNGTAYPLASTANPQGVGPSVSLAVDNTLGAYSPYQNRVYMAYVNNGGTVQVKFSDDGGVVWSNSPTSVGAGFLPKITVDQTTGTVGLAYYSTAFAPSGAPVTGDAAGIRAATMFTTSITGPNFTFDNTPGNNSDDTTPLGTLSFATPSYVNPVEEYQDQIKSNIQTFEPITSNPTRMGGEVYGNNLGLVMYNGRVNLLYGGNLNEDGAFVRTQNMTVAGGPRVVSGDSGPILATARVNSDFETTTDPNYDGLVDGILSYNNKFASDGRRQFSGFVVTFDRVIDPGTFTAADVTVKYLSPGDPDPVNGGTVLPASAIQSIDPLDNIRDPEDGSSYGSKRFLIRLTPQTAVGTYSYSINSNISDRIRNRDFKYVDNPAGTQTSTFTPSSVPNAAIPDAVGTVPGRKVFGPLNSPVAGVIGHVSVEVNITHTDISDLQLVLISPSGVRITLANAGDSGSGANYVGTVFDDNGGLTLDADLPPHSDPQHYRPAEPLQQLRESPNGAWQLEVTDTVAGNNGSLVNWKITVTPANLQVTDSNGNVHDQDGDGIEGEVDQDIFAVPNPVNGTPFALPYAPGSLPVVVSGPYVVATREVGQPASTDNLVRNAAAKSIDVQFDRTIKTSTFTPADVLRITGPLGDIALTGVTVVPIDALGGTPLANAATDSKVFRITFAQQTLSGYYHIQLSSKISDTSGNLLDTNNNAGVGNLSGGAVGAPVDPRADDKGAFSTPLPGNATTTIPLTVNEAYLLQRARVKVTIDVPGGNLRNFEGRLVAPDGTTILLFADAPSSGSASTMINTTFDDASATPVQSGGSFDNASFEPVQPLAALNGKARTAPGSWSSRTCPGCPGPSRSSS